MNGELRKYLSEIGRKGGLKSRRKLSSHSARNMVRIREARRAFRKFYVSCFWSYDPNYLIKEDDIQWVVEQLMKHGGREAWNVGYKLCH